ncbi:hypothetical protein ACO0SA_002641 [Hanseniaspora valbyensis]
MGILFKVVSLYSYSGNDDSDLSFDKDQVINVTSIENEEWYSGEYLNKETNEIKEGIFPQNFVKKISSDDESAPIIPKKPKTNTEESLSPVSGKKQEEISKKDSEDDNKFAPEMSLRERIAFMLKQQQNDSETLPNKKIERSTSQSEEIHTKEAHSNVNVNVDDDDDDDDVEDEYTKEEEHEEVKSPLENESAQDVADKVADADDDDDEEAARKQRLVERMAKLSGAGRMGGGFNPFGMPMPKKTPKVLEKQVDETDDPKSDDEQSYKPQMQFNIMTGEVIDMKEFNSKILKKTDTNTDVEEKENDVILEEPEKLSDDEELEHIEKTTTLEKLVNEKNINDTNTALEFFDANEPSKNIGEKENEEEQEKDINEENEEEDDVNEEVQEHEVQEGDVDEEKEDEVPEDDVDEEQANLPSGFSQTENVSEDEQSSITQPELITKSKSPLEIKTRPPPPPVPQSSPTATKNVPPPVPSTIPTTTSNSAPPIPNNHPLTKQAPAPPAPTSVPTAIKRAAPPIPGSIPTITTAQQENIIPKIPELPKHVQEPTIEITNKNIQNQISQTMDSKAPPVPKAHPGKYFAEPVLPTKTRAPEETNSPDIVPSLPIHSPRSLQHSDTFDETKDFMIKVKVDFTNFFYWANTGTIPENCFISQDNEIGKYVVERDITENVLRDGKSKITIFNYYVLFEDFSHLLATVITKNGNEAILGTDQQFFKNTIDNDTLENITDANILIIEAAFKNIGTQANTIQTREWVKSIFKAQRIVPVIANRTFGINIFKYHPGMTDITYKVPIKAGDILVIKNGNFSNESLESLIITEFDTKQLIFNCVLISDEGKITQGTRRLSEMEKGKLRVFRPIPRNLINW